MATGPQHSSHTSHEGSTRNLGTLALHRSFADGAQAESDTLSFMAKMPAWKDHPRVTGAS